MDNPRGYVRADVTYRQQDEGRSVRLTNARQQITSVLFPYTTVLVENNLHNYVVQCTRFAHVR